MVSIIIPALNEEQNIRGLIAELLALPGEKEVIVADGESEDRTVEFAMSAGAKVVPSRRGRGAQLRAGAAASSGDVLWFVHADSSPGKDSLAAISRALEDEGVAGGNFALVFEGRGLAARQMTWIYPKLRLLGLSYGDAGIFVRRTAYDAIGGVRPFRLFEDLDLVRRLRPVGRFAHLDCRMVTSSRRFAGRRYALAWATWIVLQILFWAGVSADRLARWYRPAQ